ncbi:MAG: GntR family transcriptional regulator [Pirellulaceae bacterium]
MRSKQAEGPPSSGRIERAPSLVTQVERLLREAIGAGRYPDCKLPTEVQLAEQLGVSRETVRRATETLAAEGLLVKFRRKGTFIASAETDLPRMRTAGAVIGYVQADYRLADGASEPTARFVGGQMLDGALEAAAEAGRELVVRRTRIADLNEGVQSLRRNVQLAGVVFASVGEEKLLRRVSGLGVPMVLIDHDVHMSEINTLRDDSAHGARLAVEHLASLGHRRIAIAYWQATDLNPWRLEGFRQTLRDLGLPRRRKWEFLTDLGKSGARQTAEEIISLTPRPTAIYCFNNSMARMLIEELRNVGLSAPRDISIVGGGGELAVDLTHHQADWVAIGRQAVELLIAAIENPGGAPPVHHLAPHALILGRTTAPPASPDDS